MSRILAIDYGKKRTGLAVSDPARIIAGGLCTVDTTQLLDFLADYFTREEVGQVVVGYPRQTNGEDSENMKRVRPFVNRLRKLYPQLPVDYYDERFTSVLAHRAIIDSGVGRQRRRTDKGLVDQVSATIILQDYMESKRTQI